MEALSKDIQATHALKKTEVSDKSQPMIEKETVVKKVDRKGFIDEIAHGKELSHPEEVVDKSAPVVEAGTSVKTVDRTAQLQTVKHGAMARELAGDHDDLKHVETADKSIPVVDKDVKIKKVDRKGFLGEVAAPHELKHADTVDKAAPAIEAGTEVTKVDRCAQLQTIKHGAAMRELQQETAALEVMVKEMKHPEEVKDRSAPIIEKDTKVKKSNRGEFLKDVEADHKMKHVETEDHSGPKIEKVKVKKSERNALLGEIAKAPKE